MNCDFRRCENVSEVRADREENPQVDRGAGFGEAENYQDRDFLVIACRLEAKSAAEMKFSSGGD